jgi:ubiquinone/menaquinone biosynthesis C-methylase UbiE
MDLLSILPPGSAVLEVGGGHGQLVPFLAERGYRIEVLGSDASCSERIRPWIERGACSFRTGDILSLPYPDRSFDAVLGFRLLPHVRNWRGLIGELCRVARRGVVADYASSRSINAVSKWTFRWKKRAEGNTRPFSVFAAGDVRSTFEAAGFRTTGHRPQFILPMVLHRKLRSRSLSEAIEAPARIAGLTRLLGSPVIVRAERAEAVR